MRSRKSDELRTFVEEVLERLKTFPMPTTLCTAAAHPIPLRQTEPGTHAFDRTWHKFVICEGLWILHREEVREMFDYAIAVRREQVDRIIAETCQRNQTHFKKHRSRLIPRADSSVLLRKYRSTGWFINAVVVSICSAISSGVPPLSPSVRGVDFSALAFESISKSSTRPVPAS